MDTEWITNEHWVMSHCIDKREIIIFAITASSAGLNVDDYYWLRIYTDGYINSFVGYNYMNKNFTMQSSATEIDKIVTYNQVMKALREIIRRDHAA